VQTGPTAPLVLQRTKIVSLVKGAMNAPHCCKFCKGCLTGIGHGPVVLSMAKKDHCALANCEGVAFPKHRFMIVNCGMKKRDLIQVGSEFSPLTSKSVVIGN
jgi:hypothetical protein